MQPLCFSWGASKAERNIRKHRVTFQEASSVFRDERAIEFADPEHSSNEERFLMLGISSGLRVLMVSFCYHEDENVIRVITARKATKAESQEYWKRGHT